MVHKTCEFYKKLYLCSTQVPKKDRFGVWLKIENICLETINLIITAALAEKDRKNEPLSAGRVKLEMNYRKYLE